MDRRLFLAGLMGVAAATPSRATEPFHISPYEESRVEYKFRKREVKFATSEAPGTIVIDTRKKFLFFVLPGGKAMRYGIGVGSQFTRWDGTAKITRMAHWPTWTPTPEMLARHKHYAQWAKGMPGGPDNPLGARAMYLLNGGGVDNNYRIHGTPAASTIGQASTSGCFRMLNVDVIDLFNRVKVGTKVLVLPNAGSKRTKQTSDAL